MRELAFFVMMYILILWDFTYIRTYTKKEKTKYFYLKYKGILWAIMDDGYLLTSDWGTLNPEENEDNPSI